MGAYDISKLLILCYGLIKIKDIHSQYINAIHLNAFCPKWDFCNLVLFISHGFHKRNKLHVFFTNYPMPCIVPIQHSCCLGSFVSKTHEAATIPLLYLWRRSKQTSQTVPGIQSGVTPYNTRWEGWVCHVCVSHVVGAGKWLVYSLSSVEFQLHVNFETKANAHILASLLNL